MVSSKRPAVLSALLSTVLIVILLSLFSTNSFGKPVNKNEAEKAVKGWLKTDAKPMGESLGKEIADTEVYNDPDGTPAYYIVYLNPTGFVIVSADDLVEPIVGFVPGTGIYDPSSKSTLGTLVSNDLPVRAANARQIQKNIDTGIQKKDLSKGKAALHEQAIKAQGKWKNLQVVADNPPPTYLGSISDVRVPVLINSRWDQSNVCGGYCYNYYTPSHVYDGCVATAMAQEMRYWQYPTAGIGKHKIGSYTTRGGDGNGGPYVWSEMMLAPAANCSILTDTQRQAIGSLCYDAGVAAKMQYSSSGSGAYMSDAAYALRTTFMYSNVICGGNGGSDIPAAGRTDMINSNLDAGMPVLLGIYHPGGDGHAIDADGYGYQSSTLYTHLNLGWGGDCDSWYNLPNIDDSYYSFSVVDTVIYNIWTSGSGEIISGRVTYSSSGAGFAGATVTATGTGGPYTTTTNSNGIYALVKVHSGTAYTVTVTASGCTFSPSSLSVTTGTSVDAYFTSGNKRDNDFTTSCAPPNPPPAPASITYPTTSSTGVYTVSWPSSSGASSYEMDRSSDGGSTWSMRYSGANISYSESIGNGSYRYRVKAMNAGGSSAWTTGTSDCVVTVGPPVPPTPPASITYPSSSRGKHAVSWATSSGATSYQLARSSDGGVNWSSTPIYDGASTTYQENITDGSYRYRVKATNSYGTSDWTAGSTDCVVVVPPPIIITFSAGTSAGWDLQALACDIARNNTVGMDDLSVIAQNWLGSSCGTGNQWCNKADIDKSTDVTFTDYARLADDWGRQAGQSVLLQTIYGTAQNSAGQITANTTRAVQSFKGMAMAFAVPQTTLLDKGTFKLTGLSAGHTAEVRLYNVTGKGYLTYNHGSVSRSDPGSGGNLITDTTLIVPNPAPYHAEGSQNCSDLIINFGPMEVTAGEYLLVFDTVATNLTTACSMVKGLAGTVAAGMGTYPDGTPLPKRATVTTSTAAGSTYYYYLGSSTDVNYSHASDQFAFQITTYAINQAPQVDAGFGQTITEPNNTALLEGTVTDDGLPNPPGAVTTLWTVTSGPGTVTFADANAMSTTATFSATGTYVLRLTANDGALTGYDETIITYQPAPPQNQAPVVDAGIDQTITEPNTATLEGTVTDDGLPNPPGAVATTWTQQSGPGTVTFGDANSIDTTADFSEVGVYVLRLTANDGDLSNYDEVIITVQ